MSSVSKISQLLLIIHHEEKSNTAIVTHEYVRGLYVTILTQTVCELDNYLAPSDMFSHLRDGYLP